MISITSLPDRGVIAIEGDDRVAFLQGLVSNDVAAVRPGHPIWAAFLTPQGKWLADFFIIDDGSRLLVDCERQQMEDLAKRLSRYRLRLRVTLQPEPEMTVQVAWGGKPAADQGFVPDPRLPDFAWRKVTGSPEPTTATPEQWDRYRLSAGLPDGSKDMETDRSVLLEAGFDELNGVSWSKGCYMGQELTARTKYRGLIKRRLVPVTIEGPLPEPGSPILRDGIEVGTMRSARDGLGLATLRLDAMESRLTCGDAKLTPRVPDWMRLPATQT
ncbi:MAG TPA: folate-binding protein [Acidisoma sp.]|jgi:folate-binding protein YgfZ|uniref:CAF17-like 4Fe-4S cluster assembly/insertion protein YgfZ n=1 Tax=Acidisoma sp. TaxID=1872115 RepID=UPI002D176722|nr:folate-binding protein [Acidisoma sp.]HTI01649.1 folate-binding protein [Acidisoma sp.]